MLNASTSAPSGSMFSGCPPCPPLRRQLSSISTHRARCLRQARHDSPCACTRKRRSGSIVVKKKARQYLQVRLLTGMILGSAEYRHPHLGAHVRVLVVRQDNTRPSAIPVVRDGHEGQRQDIWDMVVGLIGRCPNVETLIWETGLGVNSEMWKVRCRRSKA